MNRHERGRLYTLGKIVLVKSSNSTDQAVRTKLGTGKKWISTTLISRTGVEPRPSWNRTDGWPGSASLGPGFRANTVKDSRSRWNAEKRSFNAYRNQLKNNTTFHKSCTHGTDNLMRTFKGRHRYRKGGQLTSGYPHGGIWTLARGKRACPLLAALIANLDSSGGHFDEMAMSIALTTMPMDTSREWQVANGNNRPHVREIFKCASQLYKQVQMQLNISIILYHTRLLCTTEKNEGPRSVARLWL